MTKRRHTMRHFYCQDALWRFYHGKAEALGCSIDQLLNDALRHFAREKLTPRPTPPPRTTPQPTPAPRTTPRPRVTPPPPPPPPTLILIFNDQRIRIDKDQFIIGRKVSTSDLAIRDGNISRRHAAIIRRNGAHYIKDLGSTNGVQFRGMRIDNRRVEEGDLFLICDYELRFTYRGG